MREEKERVPERKYPVSEFQRFKSSEFLIWRDHCGRLASCHLKGSPPTPATTREKQESWGHMGNMLAIAQAGECLVSQRPFLMLATISRGKKRIWSTHKNM